jgi:hypothetical protein
MSAFTDILLTDLRHLIAEMGVDGGLMSSSIYDSAQVLRFTPHEQNIWPAVDWLISQQRDDGGWGDPTTPRARDLPTLAALLTLRKLDARHTSRDAIRHGQAFLNRQAIAWSGQIYEDITSGVELLLPSLFEEAAGTDIEINPEPYRSLIDLGERRRAQIARHPPAFDSTPVHSWEAWGQTPDPDLIDRYGSIGHSPAATARWLRDTQDNPAMEPARAAARRYLQQASAATGVGIPGIVPTCWPIPRFEQAFGLQPLYLAGLLDHPALSEVVQPKLAELAGAMTAHGMGASDVFAADGDNTAVSLTLLQATGRPVDVGVLMAFANGDHFCAWQGELQPSLSVTSHAVHALQRLGHETGSYESFIVSRQLPDGRWPGDKWNGSWLYTTWRCIVALSHTSRATPIRRATSALLAHQRPDGGWGRAISNPEETAYALLALRSLPEAYSELDGFAQAIRRGERWLREQYRPFAPSQVTCWLAKEIYRPQRIARAIELAALLASFDAPVSL